MGLNGREIQLRLFKVLHVSVNVTFNFVRKHPIVSGALLIFFSLYIFLSYIFNLLVFLFPFVVCTIIFVGIFWSSEQTQLRFVKEEEKKEEVKRVEPKVPKYEKCKMLYKFPSQNATSRRRNFTGKRLDVYGGIEEKAKDLSAVFCNEFIKMNAEIGRIESYEKDLSHLGAKLSVKKPDAPKKHVIFAEPSMLDVVSLERNAEKNDDEKKIKEDINKALGLGEEDQKTQMDLGVGETERYKRLESLIARRKARKQLKQQIENGLVDMKFVVPSQIAPLFITKPNHFDSPREYDGIEMPGSAPSALRSPFDLPYDPSEEKPILTGDTFLQDLSSHQKDMAYSKLGMIPGKENHDKLEQPISKEDGENESKGFSPKLEGEETSQEEDEKGKIEMDSIKDEEVNNSDATNDETASEKLESIAPKPQERVFNFPISCSAATNINDSLYESLSSPVDKNQEDIVSSSGRHISHIPSLSLASDLQVEVSEVGSPTLTHDESHETITTTDGESMIYDGDIDRDVNSGSEDMWGGSFHSREVNRLSEEDISEINNWRDISSPITLVNIDEENAADVSSMSSGDMADDTPTHAMTSDHNNFFGNMKDFERENYHATQLSHSSDVTSRWKRLIRLMDTRFDKLPHETQSEKPECNLSENLSKAQVLIDVRNSATSEQDNTQNIKSNEDPSASVVPQEATHEVSTNTSSSSSPRSVLLIPQKTIEDQVPTSASNQEIHQGDQLSSNEGVAQEISNSEGPPESMPQNVQPSMDDPNVESHNNDLSHSQEQTNIPENSIQESNMSSKKNGAEDCNEEEEKKLKNDDYNEEKFTPPIREDALVEPPNLAKVMTSEDMNEKSKESYDDRVPLISLILGSSLEIHRGDEQESQASPRQEAITEPFSNPKVMDTNSTNDFEGKRDEDEAMISSCTSTSESDISQEVNHLQSESNQEVKDHMEKEKLDKGEICEEYNKMDKNEATEKELDTNETMVLSEPAEESDHANSDKPNDVSAANSEEDPENKTSD